jgi:hypothetical protein
VKEFPSFVYALRGRLQPGSAEQVLRAIETVLPNVRMKWECPNPPKPNFREIGDRGAWLTNQMSQNSDWSLFSERGLETTASVGESHQGRAVPLLTLALNAWPPMETSDDLMIACGDASQALHCTAAALVDSSLLELVATQLPGSGFPTDYVADLLAEFPLLRALPKRRALPLSGEESVAVDQIRWMNYWSDETALRMKATEDAFAALPAARCEKTKCGWYFRLTDDPLDVRRSEHQRALIAAYGHLTTVGVR